MTKVIDAVYEGGLFRPTEKVELAEGSRVQVHVQPSAPAARRDPKKVAELLAAVAATAPRTGKPDDAATDHDKYLYGRGQFATVAVVP